VNVLNFKNVPPIVFPAFLTLEKNGKNVPPIVFPAFLTLKKIGPTSLTPPENGASALSGQNSANTSLEKWGSRVEEPSNFHLQEYLGSCFRV